MPPSIEPTDQECRFAADVLSKLLHHIAVENVKNTENDRQGHYVFSVSHAWTDGATLHLVYTTPPSNIIWGLVRDTRESLINPSPWRDTDDPALYYYLLDLEEGWPGFTSSDPGQESDVIHWLGDPRSDVPERISDVPEPARHVPPLVTAAETRYTPPPLTEPRRYANPLL